MLYLSKSSHTTMEKYSITSKRPAFILQSFLWLHNETIGIEIRFSVGADRFFMETHSVCRVFLAVDALRKIEYDPVAFAAAAPTLTPLQNTGGG